MLVAVIVPNGAVDKLERAWSKLQQRILVELRSDYPPWQKYEQTHLGALPEVHAVNLWQSGGYYRKHPYGAGNGDRYWRAHQRWLGEAFEIQGRFWLPIVAIHDPVELTDPAARGAPRLSEIIRDSWKGPDPVPRSVSRHFEKMDHLQARPYTFALPQLLCHLDDELARRGWTADVTCDDDASNVTNGENSGFRLSRLMRLYQESGRLRHLTGLSFQHSHLSVGLQVADIHAYAVSRALALSEGWVRRKAGDDLLERWADDYTLKQRGLVQDQPLSRQQRGVINSLAFEYVLRNSGLPAAVLETALSAVTQTVWKVAGSPERDDALT